MNRRDFVVGAVTGAAATGLAGLAGAFPARRLASAQAAAPVPAKPAVPEPLPAPSSDRKIPACDPDEPSRLSFAQEGEDLILFNLLHHVLRLSAPSYLDIGAGDPVLSNNTYLLYNTGSHGVLVEPNPTLVEKIRQVRPNDVVVQAGVGVSEVTEADYYVFRDHSPLNTFSPEVVAERRRTSKVDPVEKVLKMPLISVNRLIKEHFTGAPDLLSIDVEGLDFDVLRSLDFRKYRPAVICAETKGPEFSHDNTPIARLLKPRGYIACAGSLYNTIFVDGKRFKT
ncbi:MAG: FkbM family methyltransferase [Acidobacteria bacterium]|nr:FkbM family methyltransferase [Acidobacteriota bacterium]